MAGTDHERLGDLQSAFDDLSIDGVWALRGGYGTLRILDGLNLDRQRRDPIPFLGFSDNTTIHQRHRGAGTISFHAPHPGAAFPAETEESLRRTLFSTDPPGALPLRHSDPSPRPLTSGRVEGELVGGNLAILAALSGSRDALQARGKILFLEDLGEPPYRIDRMLTQLDRSGALEGVAGLAFGRFLTPDPADEEEANRILEEFAGQLAVPAIADLPFGHVDHNCTLPVGGVALLDADSGTLTLTEPVVRSV
jgi:muramoyltetrapeptide carboxypeptidase